MKPYNLEQLTSVQHLGVVFRIIGKVATLTGRRKLRGELDNLARLHMTIPYNLSKEVAMDRRAKRRARVRELRAEKRAETGASAAQLREQIIFRPVVGYRGLPARDHKQAIAALRTINQETAEKYAARLLGGKIKVVECDTQ